VTALGLLALRCNAPIVADDGDPPGLLLSARRFRISGRLESERGGCGRKDENELLVDSDIVMFSG
jgi:hypothetical protein